MIAEAESVLIKLIPFPAFDSFRRYRKMNAIAINLAIFFAKKDIFINHLHV